MVVPKQIWKTGWLNLLLNWFYNWFSILEIDVLDVIEFVKMASVNLFIRYVSYVI